MVRPELVRRKLSQLHGYLEELERHRNISYEEYAAGGVEKRAVERLLGLTVEVVVDLNTHLVSELRGTPPTDYADSFKAVAETGVIPADLAESLKPSAGLRNILVHEYGDIDDAIVHSSIPLALDGFAEYSKVVSQWLESRQSP